MGAFRKKRNRAERNLYLRRRCGKPVLDANTRRRVQPADLCAGSDASAPCLGARNPSVRWLQGYIRHQKASAQMVKIKETIEPDSGRHEEYRFYFEKIYRGI